MRWNPVPYIQLDLTPSSVIFVDPDGPPLRLAPVVYVAADGRRRKILGVGDHVTRTEPAVRIEVFSADPPPLGISKLDCLGALFTHGFKLVLDRSLFRIKPEVRVRGAETLSKVFGGYERDVLGAALVRAGARKIVWPEDSGGGTPA